MYPAKNVCKFSLITSIKWQHCATAFSVLETVPCTVPEYLETMLRCQHTKSTNFISVNISCIHSQVNLVPEVLETVKQEWTVLTDTLSLLTALSG